MPINELLRRKRKNDRRGDRNQMNGILAIFLVGFLIVASAGALLWVNASFGAYLDGISWLMITGVLGVIDIFVLIKAEHQSNQP